MCVCHLVGLWAGEASCQRSTAGGQRGSEGGATVRQQGLQVAAQLFRTSDGCESRAKKTKKQNSATAGPHRSTTAPPVVQKLESHILEAEEASNASRILPVEVVPDPERPCALVFGVPPG